MHPFLKKTLLIIPLMLLFSACTDVEVKIQGYTNINANSTYVYKAKVIVDEDEEVKIERYQWSVLSGESLVVLNNSSTKEVEIETKKVGKIVLHVEIVAEGKTYEDEMTISIHKKEIVNGYTLPAKPDEELNKETVLGIDSNDNGVRDDVERYVLKKYKNHHKIVSEIALQSGRAFQIILNDPSKAKETTKFMDAAQDCNWYFKDDADYFGDKILIDHNIMNDDFEDLQLNTKKRVRAYLKYNQKLSGGVYRLSKYSERKGHCDFNTSQLLKIQ